MAAPAPPTLQIAQVLADLSDLNVADPTAATALLTAPLSLSKSQSSVSNSNLPARRNSSHAALQRMLSDSARENNMRIRFMSPKSASPVSTPSLSRQVSLSGDYNEELEPDLARASTLLILYETRGHFKQMENKGLARARANVEEVRARYMKLVEESN